MKIKDGYVLRQVAGNNIVVAAGPRTLDFDGMITLNGTGTFLWTELEKGADEQKLVARLLEEYEIDEQTAAADVKVFVKKLNDSGLIDA